MIIAIAGPYSADTGEQRQLNLNILNEAAAKVLEMGHIPLIGINAALPVVERSKVADPYEALMKISLAVVNACDAFLLLKESPGANRERDLMLLKGKPVYTTLAEIPKP